MIKMKREKIITKRFKQARCVTFKNIDTAYKSNGLIPEDNDEILAYYDEPFESENNSYDGGAVLEIFRKRPYTEEEKERRKKCGDTGS